jgi:hypothetical protein
MFQVTSDGSLGLNAFGRAFYETYEDLPVEVAQVTARTPE